MRLRPKTWQRMWQAMWVLMGVMSWQASGQTLESSGNGLLHGTYYFRQVVWATDGTGSGALGEALAIYGNITFDGNGNYNLSNTQLLDGSAGGTFSYNPTGGTYTISAGGLGFISSPAAAYLGQLTGVLNTDLVYGSVSAQGYFVGSATENGLAYNDMMIAAPLSSPAPTLSTFKGNYMVADLDFTGGNPLTARDALLTMNPDGNGTLGTVQASGYIAQNGPVAVRQSIGGVKYISSGGAYNVTFGGTLTNANLIAGNHYLYISPDGNFVFGGSPTGWDMMAGVRISSTPTFDGLYYQAGMEVNVNNLANGFAIDSSHFGSLKAFSGNTLIGHQRVLSTGVGNAYDLSYSETFSLGAGGTMDINDSIANQHYLFGSGGGVRVGLGNDPFLSLNVAVQGPTFNYNRPDVFLDPTGIGNAASSALFTAGVAPGELITLYGANLASKLMVDLTFPKQLGNVQVMINGVQAPILFVSQGLVEVMVPYEVSNSLITSIQLFNNGTASNTVTTFTSITSPGAFTVNATGLGEVWARHADAPASQITPANPAKVGETIYIAANGLGQVTPPINTGDPGPSGTPATTFNNFTIFVDGIAVAQPLAFEGLTPTAIGLGQFNFVIPAGVHTGDVTLELIGPDSDTFEGVLSVSSATFTGFDQPAQPAPLTERESRPAQHYHEASGSARPAAPHRVIPGDLGSLPRIP